METFDLKIRGVSNLLVHAFAPDFGDDEKVKMKGEGYGTPREQIERTIYCDNDGEVWIPSTWIKGCLVSASSEYKVPGSRKSFKSIIGGAIFPTDERCYFSNGLKKEDLEVDSRPVCIQRARIMRHRAKVETPWELSLQLEIEKTLIDPKTVLKMLNDGGKRVGIGDFRPQCSGPFGRFQVSYWKEFDPKAVRKKAAKKKKKTTRR